MKMPSLRRGRRVSLGLREVSFWVLVKAVGAAGAAQTNPLTAVVHVCPCLHGADGLSGNGAQPVVDQLDVSGIAGGGGCFGLGRVVRRGFRWRGCLGATGCHDNNGCQHQESECDEFQHLSFPFFAYP